jgi:putative transposase
MSTFTQILYHIVFSTRNRERTLAKSGRAQLQAFIAGIIQNKKCHLYRIGSADEHLHIVTHLHPTVALAELVKDIKLASSKHIKSTNLFPGFSGWQNGYGGFTYSIKEKDRLIKYAMNQEEHHKTVGFDAEFKSLLEEHQIPFDEKYLL